MKVKTIRKHDLFYLKENRYKKTKEIFKFVGKKIAAYKKKNKKKISIADFGCANGEFQYYLYKTFKPDKIFGYDVIDKLLSKAKKKIPQVSFNKGSILKRNTCKKNSFDITTAIGVLTIFDSFEKTIDNLIYWTRPKGKILLHALLNEFPLDVNVKYSHSNNWEYEKPKFWESGWNIYSKETIKKFLKKKKIKSFKFNKFTLKTKLKKQKDVLRTWSASLDNKKILLNGLNIVQPHYIIEIDLL